MKRKVKTCTLVCLAVFSLLVATGCVDGVRQAIVPQLFSGVQTIADGLITGADPNSLTSGAQSIADGLIAGLRHAVYPEG